MIQANDHSAVPSRRVNKQAAYLRALVGLIFWLRLILPGMLSAQSDPLRADPDTMKLVVQGHLALRAFDTVTASDLAHQIDEKRRSATDVRYFLGQLAFYKGQYEAALKLFGDTQFVGPRGDLDDFPEYVKRVAEATRGLAVKESPHFSVRYQADGPDRILIDYTLDVLEKAYQAIGSELNYFPAEKIRLEIFPDSDRFIQASGLKAEEIETTGTVALCIYNKLMITSPRALALGYRWMDTLSHEFVHLLVARKSGNAVPVWLQEGLAKFFEVRWRGGRGADMTIASESLLAEAMAANKFVPFERMSPSLAKLPSAEEAQLAFAQVQTAIEFLISKKNLAGVRQLIDEMGAGKSDREAVEIAFGSSFSDFEKQWKQFIAAKRLRTIPGITVLPTILKAQAIAEGEAREEQDINDPLMAKYKALREFTRLGDLLRERSRFKAALIEYEKARKSVPVESPALSVKIGLTYLQAENPDQAIQLLEQTVARYPSFAPAFTTLGYAYLTKGTIEAAKVAFQEANAINPFDPSVHKQLAEIYGLLGDLDRAQVENRVLQHLTTAG